MNKELKYFQSELQRLQIKTFGHQHNMCSGPHITKKLLKAEFNSANLVALVSRLRGATQSTSQIILISRKNGPKKYLIICRKYRLRLQCEATAKTTPEESVLACH